MAKNIVLALPLINDDTRIIPGHGPLSNKADLQAFHDMLVATLAEVESMMGKRMNLEQIQKAGLSGQWQEWTDGFLSSDVWIGILYGSLN